MSGAALKAINQAIKQEDYIQAEKDIQVCLSL